MDARLMVAALVMGLSALVATTDALYFHRCKYRLFARPESVAEHRVHTIRAVLFGPLVYLLLGRNFPMTEHSVPWQYTEVDRQVRPSGQALPPSKPLRVSQVPPRMQAWPAGQLTVPLQRAGGAEPELPHATGTASRRAGGGCGPGRSQGTVTPTGPSSRLRRLGLATAFTYAV